MASVAAFFLFPPEYLLAVLCDSISSIFRVCEFSLLSSFSLELYFIHRSRPNLRLYFPP